MSRPAELGREVIEVFASPLVPGVELRAGRRVCAPVSRHWHEEYQFCLIEAGAGTVAYRGTSYGTPAATLFCVAPGEVHSNEARDSEGCCFRTVFLSPQLVSQALNWLRMDIPTFRVTDSSESPVLVNAF